MKLSLPNDVYIVRDTGLPVEGRMKVYLHESDTYADVFTIEGSEYVQAENPQLLHAGLPEASLFTDTGVYDIVIEQYIGQEGAMSVESPDEDFSKIDEFQWGLDFNPEAYVATRVDSISDLRDVDPSVKSVTVSWYDEPGDCFPRTYVWDPDAQNEADGGYVVASDVSDSGRWILAWGDEVLPACVYGVKPGHEENMNLLLNYPEFVGSFQLRTAPAVRFQAGTYTSSVTYATPKTLFFDRGAKFTGSTFRCPWIHPEGGNSSYIADFVFTGSGVEAHSSWFRSVTRFWACNAQKLVIDTVDYFTDRNVSAQVNIQNAVIEGARRIEQEYVNGAYLKFTNCTVVGQKIFAPGSDILWFYGMEFREEWFNAHTAANFDFGQVTQGHRLNINRGQQNIVRFENFITPDVYLKACLADPSVTDFDGHGASYTAGLSTNSKFTSIKNMEYSGAIADSECDTWKNVTAGAISFSGVSRYVTMRDCSFSVSGSTSSVAQLALYDCTVGAGKVSPDTTALYVEGGTWLADIELSDSAKASRARNRTVSFHGCNIVAPNHLWLNDIVMMGCRCNSHIKLVPWSGTGFGVTGSFIKNVFVGSALVDINVDNPATELDVHGVSVAVRIEDNVFEQAGDGIRMPYRTADFNHYFLDIGSADLSYYRGNRGNCPLEQHDLKAFDASAMTETYGTGSGAFHYLGSSTNRRVWNLNPTPAWSVDFGNMYERDSLPNPVNGRGSAMYLDYLIHIGVTDFQDANNDQFLVTHAWEQQQGFNTSKSVAIF